MVPKATSASSIINEQDSLLLSISDPYDLLGL